MGILINGVNGAFSGKVGNMVGSSWLGKSYVKSMPKKSKKPQSEKQLAQQAKFALATRLLQPVKDMLFTFRKPKMAASGYNMAMRYVLQHAITGNYPDFEIDHSQMIYSQGSLGSAQGLDVLADGGTLMVGWWPDRNRFNAFDDDEVQILIYDPEAETYIKGPSGIVRCEGMCTIPLPSEQSGHTLHVYVSCISRNGGKYSYSQYAGAVHVDF